jgi:hypothetical protein
MNRFVVAAACVLTVGELARAEIEVADDSALQNALRQARAGDVIRIAPGRYRPGVYASQLRGSENSPIVIEAANLEQPPRFEGGSVGWHLQGCAWVTLKNLEIADASGNGINIDDGGGAGGRHITLDGLRVSGIGPTGNRDGIKLSGLDDFVVRNCRVEGWGGEGIDMVGCHRGVVEECTFIGREGHSQTCGVQTKGGSRDVVIRRCRFEDVAGRSVNIGGSTGKPYFRPADATYEAKDITVEGCTFIGSDAPVSFVGVDGAVVRYNTIVNPRRWILRILQETTAPEFVPSRNGVFEHNLILFKAGEIRTPINIGGSTAPETFVFRENWWYASDRPSASRPSLPTPEEGGVYGLDPRWREVGGPGNSEARGYGARALRGEQADAS